MCGSRVEPMTTPVVVSVTVIPIIRRHLAHRPPRGFAMPGMLTAAAANQTRELTYYYCVQIQIAVTRALHRINTKHELITDRQQTMPPARSRVRFYSTLHCLKRVQ